MSTRKHGSEIFFNFFLIHGNSIKEDFKAGLLEMATMANESKDEDALPQFDLPVFTVSSMDFQKLIGHYEDDGPPSTFHNVRLNFFEIESLRFHHPP